MSRLLSPALQALQQRLGHVFADAGLLSRAVTHKSFGADHYERLEFLGDAVLSLRGLPEHRRGPAAGRRRSSVRDPWIQAVQDRLAHRAAGQGWRRVPPVLDLG